MTIASSRLPAPTSWDVFEAICRDAFGARWSNPNLTKHGRQGQRQHAVDIYGQDHAGNFVGIQCKNTTTPITSVVVTAEVASAESFTPPITTLYIATTCDTDATLQQHVRTLSNDRVLKGKFGVEIVSWPEIVQDLGKDPALVMKHYPQYFLTAAATPGSTQRDRDGHSLRRLLEVIDFDAMDEWLTWGAKFIHSIVEDHLDRIKAVRNSPVFAMSDPQMLLKIDQLVTEWVKLRTRMGFAHYDLHPNGMLVFYMPGDACQTPEDERAYAAIGAQLGILQGALHALSEEVKRSYPEIDLAATSRTARQLYA